MDELEYHSIHLRSTENVGTIFVIASMNLINSKIFYLIILITISKILNLLTKRQLPISFILVLMGFGRIKDIKKIEKDVAKSPAIFDQASLTR